MNVTLDQIYDVLVDIGGASEQYRVPFISEHLHNHCREWRFCGHLGFGGKYRRDRNKVDYYPEDETPERNEIVVKVNKALEEL